MACNGYVKVYLSAALAIGTVLGGLASPAAAEEKLNIIVPLGIGGALDRFARTAEQFLPNSIDAKVEVENFSPKKGEDGYQAFLDRPADGKTILAWFEPSAAAYEPGMSLDDLAIINVQEIEAPILAARSDLGWTNLQEMIQAIRARPESYRFGVGGTAGGGPLLTNALFSNLDIKIHLASYTSGGKARKAVAKGEADFTAGSLNAIRKLGETITPLAVFAPRRQRAWPEVPTIREALGAERDEAVHGAVYRFFAIRKAFAESNPEGFAQLVEAFRRMTRDDPAFQAHSKEQGVGARWFGPKDSTALIRRSHQQYTNLISQQRQTDQENRQHVQ
jgi:tripartite-type tricarboxylate transporter receptor subunit TctC